MDVATSPYPPLLFRVARSSSALRFSAISPGDAERPRASNRYDVPGGGVLYAASDTYTCFAETLARFRPTPAIRALLREKEPDFVVCGGVPQDWRLQRKIFTLQVVDALPFLDIEAPETLTHLEAVLANELTALGYDRNLDLEMSATRTGV